MSNQGGDSCCGFLFVIIIFFGFIHLIDRIHNSTIIPTTVFPGLEINSAKVSNLTLSNPISARWNIDMNIVNYYSDHISFGFYDNTVSIFHESKEGGALWMTSFQKFDLRPGNPKAHFTLDFVGSSTEVDNSTVKAIRDKIANNYGAVKFVVQFKAHKPIIWLENPLDRLWYDSNIDVVVARCQVELLFGSSDQTQANMIRI
ncbi:hypothetical protein POM88_047605 [Heracleum sosnowskyi]|uniref:Uncharacterized protein n=1 Tax=Heracleum sosnowskyi TaxID=360622 RepID=A0AAD8LZR2_9APIA|nr:hypothetical protein POM88_047605 [Heracleum sosnowskyi]